MKNTQLLILCLATFISSNAIAAKMGKMSVEKFIDAETSFWQVDVTCSDGVNKGVMVRNTETDPWCSATNSENCDKNKFSMARQLCNESLRNAQAKTSSNSIVNTPKPQESVKVESTQNASNEILSTVNEKTNENSDIIKNPSALHDEQLKIEEEKLQIEQKKLELRRKELELQKRQLDENTE